MSDVVLFDELVCQNGKKIGVATLNSERSLNALSGGMIDLLSPKLIEWQQDSDIAVVLLQGAGEKAFCAGGDVVHLYNEMSKAGDGEHSVAIESYFTKEYSLDYLIHTYGKPILCWGNGIIMGGGLGLLAGASHKVVTETARIAMPEITIGLFPDVGATWFLNKMPEGCGLFLGLTGASVNCADAKFSNLADYIISSTAKTDILDKMLDINWGDTISLNHEKLSQLLHENQLSGSAIPEAKLRSYHKTIVDMTSKATLPEIVNEILAFESDDKWMARAQASLIHGSAISAHLVHQQLDTGKELKLAACFQKELAMAVKCGQFGEFREGVRALLIDKDNKPNWKFEDVHSVEAETINWFFEPIWDSSNHPLANIDS